MATQPRPSLTPDEYLALEREAEHKSEYMDGEAVAMAGASFNHNLIVANVVGALWGRLRGTPCAVVSSDLKVKATSRLYYPDVTVVCGEPRFLDKAQDVLLNPTLIVEVLSESTKNFDRGEKFMRYRTIDSLRDYVLIAQDGTHVEHFRRQGEHWILMETRDAQGRLALDIRCSCVRSSMTKSTCLVSPPAATTREEETRKGTFLPSGRCTNTSVRTSAPPFFIANVQAASAAYLVPSSRTIRK